MELRTGWVERFMGGNARTEAQLIQGFLQEIHHVQADDRKTAKAQRADRAFHAKSHVGVTNATFHVSDNLPPALRLGILQPGASYTATVRLSNGSGVPKPDSKRDLRGIAVRLYAQGNECDLLATNAPASHARNAEQFIDFARAMSGSKLLLLPRLIWRLGLLESVRIFVTVLKQTGRKVVSLATEQYWSRAPYALGPYALKFTFAPVVSANGAPGTDDNYLRTEFVTRLSSGEVAYDLKAQFWLDEKRTPIEDGAVEWKEADAPPVTLGRLTIPQQDLQSAAAAKVKAAVDLMEFNPWRSTAMFRPLSSLNRARRLVYEASAAFRQTVLGPAEPTTLANSQPAMRS